MAPQELQARRMNTNNIYRYFQFYYPLSSFQTPLGPRKNINLYLVLFFFEIHINVFFFMVIKKIFFVSIFLSSYFFRPALQYVWARKQPINHQGVSKYCICSGRLKTLNKLYITSDDTKCVLIICFYKTHFFKMIGIISLIVVDVFFTTFLPISKLILLFVSGKFFLSFLLFVQK